MYRVSSNVRIKGQVMWSWKSFSFIREKLPEFLHRKYGFSSLNVCSARFGFICEVSTPMLFDFRNFLVPIWTCKAQTLVPACESCS